jgi:sterol desaturase/sphingolipid hydroxylase (fatty acid hydroxylase superfamily)
VDTLIQQLAVAWHALVPNPWLRQIAVTAVFLGFYYVVVAVLERISQVRSESTYRSVGFYHDIAYYFYFKGGIGRIIVPAAVATSLAEPLSFASLRLLEGLPLTVQFVCYLLVSDFVGYWVHRARHHFRFLWAFHTTHHSQTDLNFATYTRVHLVEDFTGLYVGLFIALLLGVSPITGTLTWLLLDAIGQLTHSRISWRFGPLRWILVTPRFHSYHHSLDPAHRDRNFGILFSFWDRLFGTAVDENSPVPVSFGIAEVKPTTLWSTVVAPFELLMRYYGPRRPITTDALSEQPPSEAR